MSLDVNKMTKDQLRQHILMLAMELTQLEKENKKLKEYNGELIENHKKDIAILCEENKKLKEEIECVYKAYHTAMGVDYDSEEDLYTNEDIEGHNAE